MSMTMKRIVSLVLCLVLIVGVLPVNALALPQPKETAAPVDAAIFFSDLHTNKSDYKESTVKGIMTAFNSTGLPFSSVTSCGDAFSVNKNSSGSNGPYDGYTSKITGYIQNVLGSIPVNYVWSDHDRYALEADDKTLLDKTSRFVYGAGEDGVLGTDDDANYYVYSLSMGDLCSYDRYKAGFNYNQTSNKRESNGFTETVDLAIENFEAEAESLHKDRPLFIASHQPLFDRRNDNAHAMAWFEAINEVAEDMDVAFFFGHNHKYDESGDYYYAKGSEMPVAKSDGWNYKYETGVGYKPSVELSSEKKVLNFTHMCAGYLEPSSTGSTSSTTRTGTAMGVAIYDDSIVYTTYNSKGIYSGSYALNVTVPRDHASETQEPDPTEPSTEATEPVEPPVDEPIVDPATHITVKAPGATGLTVQPAERPAAADAVFEGDVVAWDITVDGFENDSGTADVTVPIPAGMDPARFSVYHLHDNGELTEVPGELNGDGTYTFHTTHFSVYVGGQKITQNPPVVGGGASGTGSLPGDTLYRLDTDGVEDGGQYLIVNASSGNNAQVLRNNNGEKGKQSVPIQDDQTIHAGFTNESTSVWTFTSSGSGYLVSNGNQKLRLNNDDILDANGQELTVTDQNEGYRISADVSNWNGSTTYYLTYGNYWSNDWTRNWTASNVYLFKHEETSAAEVTFQLQNPSEMITGGGTQELIYAVTLSNGETVNTCDITWESHDENIVTVDDGVLTAVSAGMDPVAITATLKSVNGQALTSPITLTVPVTVSDKPVTDIDVSPSHFVVARNSSTDTVIGKIHVTYEGGATGEVDLTLGMLMGEYDIGTNEIYENLYVSYGGRIFSGLTLEVRERVGNDYPEYPNPGSVNVDKTASATHLQSTGVVNVELSASGIPYAKGVDVIVMLDLSSSMDRCITCGQYVGRYSIDKGKQCRCPGDVKTRIDELAEAMEHLEKSLKESPNAADIKIAVADFNGYYKSGPVAYNESDRTQDKEGLTKAAKTQIYTNKLPQNQDANALNATAFIPATELDVSTFKYGDTCSSGTNYDYAFDAIYRLGYAIQQENIANGQEDRELFVLFMSDGAPNQYNFYHTTGGSDGSDDWNYWLTGAIGKDVTVVDGNLNFTFKGANLRMQDIVNNSNHYHFYDEETGNQHRMANAIKGDPNEQYTIIRKSTDGLSGVMTKADGDCMYTVPGLGANMYSIAFYVTDDGRIREEAAKHVLQNIPSSPDQYIKAENEGALAEAFNHIGGKIANAAEQAYFVDQLGDQFKLQLANTITSIDELGNKTTIDLTDHFGEGNPAIEVRTYEIYKASDVDEAKGITTDMVGHRKGSATVVERVTFKSDGSEAYSDLPSTGPNGETLAPGTNILYDNVIYASKFTYNGNSTTKTVRGKAMDSESFRWEIGTIDNQEWALSYYIYLEGSMEGNTSSGSYATNEYATLYYKNWLGNDAHKDTVSPQVGWESANVSYAFYLVNDQGQPIVNQTTGQTGSFANAVKVTSPVVYDEIMLNNLQNINTIQASSATVLPSGYDLFDHAASYKVVVLSDDGRGSWTIGIGKDDQGYDLPRTTYVTGYSGTSATNAPKVTSDQDHSGNGYEEKPDYDYTHTTVWFAVVWIPKALPDAVVIDYGLPVNISVLYNDQFGTNGTLRGIGTTEAKEDALKNATGTNIYTDKHNAAFTGSLTSTYGKAEVKGSQIRYSPTTMDWSKGGNAFDRFAYEVEYDYNEYDADGNWLNDIATQYYYGDVTVIPAANIYYEDEFVTTLRTYNSADDTLRKNGWDVDSVMASGTQDEDRPGKYSHEVIDKDNPYGYDSAYANDLTVTDENGAVKVSHFSMGHAAKVNVNADTYATAEFEFYGTGFDVISMTDSTTGVIVVNVYDADGKSVVAKTVDTYYGYTKVDGEWVPDSDASGAIYQVPVMRIGDGVQTDPLPYGKYKVRILASYIPFFDHNTTDSGYNFYLDAIRIYNPAGDAQDLVFDEEGTDRDMTIEDIYAADGEGWPRYQELRELIIKAQDFNAATEGQQGEGAIFIDHATGSYSIADYTSYGPNNELYLAKDQSVAFEIDLSDYIINKTVKDKNGSDTIIQVSNVASVQLGVKSADGSPVALTLTANNVAREREFNTTTEMYYTFSHMLDLGTGRTGADKSNDSKTTVILKNTSDADAIVSITNIKVTFKEQPNGASGIDVNWSPAIGQEALDILREPVVDDTPIVNPFTDIAEGDYFYQPVMWALKNEITAGTAEDTFSPVAGATRAQVVTFLWRAAGQPAPKGDASRFTDLEENAYYLDAVAWAVEKGITMGTTDTTFDPNSVCTRAQIVTFLYRFTGSPVVKTTNPFTDVADDAYYAPAVLWAMLNGITLGDGQSNTFNPEGICQRCQIVTFLHRAETGNGTSANS